jgi:hypothetical protein
MLSQTHIEHAAKKVKDSFKQIQISDLLAHKRHFFPGNHFNQRLARSFGG